MNVIKDILISLLIGTPIAIVVTFFATPYLWDLEPILVMELAGHSGPSDWVLLLGIIYFSFLVFIRRKINGKR